MKLRDNITALLVISGMFMALPGCEKEGPIEQAGKEADKAVAKAGQQVEKAGERIQDAAEGNKK